MSVKYLIPNINAGEFYRCEDIIKQSRFIVSFAHAPDVPSARAFIEKIKLEFKDASHNCSAFVACPPTQTTFIGYSDDGEPHGTAGKPMLTSLTYSNIGEICAVVTRYFGGVKLGTGGLVRAYQGMVELGLESLPTKMFMPMHEQEVILSYSHITLFLRLLEDYQVTILESEFGVDAIYKLILPEDMVEDFNSALVQMTGGMVLISGISQ